MDKPPRRGRVAPKVFSAAPALNYQKKSHGTFFEAGFAEYEEPKKPAFVGVFRSLR